MVAIQFRGPSMLETAFLTAALAYAEAGIAVFPCLPNDKKPACEHGHLDATTDPERIRQWWSENPNYNVAIDPASAGWSVVDADIYKPGVAEALAKIFPAGIQTYTVRTPRGGMHYYFEGSLPSTVNRIAPGIDTRGNHTGYVLASPSIVDGAPYVVIAETDISPLPAGLDGRRSDRATNSAVDASAAANARQLLRARRLLRDCVGIGDIAIEGSGGDARTYALFAQLRDLGLDQNSAIDLVDELWNPHCIPPWSEDELRLKCDNAYAYSQNAVGAWDVAPADQVFSLAHAELASHPAPTAPKKSRFAPEDDDDMDKEPDGKWLVEGVIPDQTTVLMYGPTGSYKSFVALDVALALATGKETFGQKTEAGCVFYGALEGAADIKRARRPAWRMARGITGKTPFYMMPAPRIGTPGEMEEFAEQIQLSLKGRPCRLIVLDTASKMMVGSDATKDVPRLVAFCDGLVEMFKCSVLVIHHTGRDVTKGPRDSSAYEADFDSVVRVTSPARHVVEVKVEKHKAFDAAETPYTFQGHKIGKSLVFEPTTAEQHAKLTAGEDAYEGLKIGAALRELGAYGQESGVTTEVLLSALGSTPDDKSAHDKARRALVGLAKTKLKDYCEKVGSGLIWSLPAKG